MNKKNERKMPIDEVKVDKKSQKRNENINTENKVMEKEANTKKMKKEHNKTTKTKKNKKVWKKILIVIVIIMALLIGSMYGLAKIILKGGPGVDFITKMLGKEVRGDKPVYVLVLGVNPPLSDTIMLIGYNPPTKEVSILSIPRDTYIPNVVTNKINAIYSVNGGYNKNKKDKNYEKAERAMLKKV